MVRFHRLVLKGIFIMMTVKEPTKNIVLLATEDSPGVVDYVELTCKITFNKPVYFKKGDLFDLEITKTTWEYVYKNIIPD